MIYDIHRALASFWGQFEWDGMPIPAYPSGSVPTNAPFPYITFDVIDGEAFSQGVLTGIAWCQASVESGVNVNVQRAKILDQIADAIPNSGMRLRTGKGYLCLYRNGAGFQQYYDDPDEGSGVIGGRTSVEARFYHV